MKKVFLIAVFGFLALTIGAQVSFDSTGYRAFKKTTLTSNGFLVDSSNVLFWFSNFRVKLNVNDQSKNLYFVSKPIDDVLSTGDKVKRVQCKDDGGFFCILSTGYLIDEKVNFISIEYNNIIFFYRVVKTADRLWDNDPEDLKPHEMRTKPYTPEEIDKLIKSWKDLKNRSKGNPIIAAHLLQIETESIDLLNF
jgi:hypothetical protein